MSVTSKPICLALREYLEWKKERPHQSWKKITASLAQSTECGCGYCSIACKVTNDVGDDHAVSDEMHAVVSHSGLRLQLGSGLETEVLVRSPTPDPLIPAAATISGDTGSSMSLKTTIGWLNDCLKNHKFLCPVFVHRNGPSRLPSRVIEVSLTSPQSVRLVRTNHKEGNYACLSHCWGKTQLLRTTLNPDTLSAHQRGIPWETLPKTFQEAILVTKRLGLRYLWIDSLCIIQDDKEDWQIQSAQMADIYRNCVITIAGSASSASHEGLFRKADAAHLCHSRPNINGVYTRKPLVHSTARLPLMQRSWVFQERLLSPRFLHFGEQELIWECMERIACECGRMRIDDPLYEGWLEPKHRSHPTFIGEDLERDTNKASRAWQSAVTDYSRLQLTYPSDIFPAISGIAKNFREITAWEYIAGMWKETLIIDLIWTVKSPEHVCRCEEWRAPTFSWASVIEKANGADIRVPQSIFDYRFMDVLRKGHEKNDSSGWSTITYAKVIEAKCAPTSDDATGQLSSGYIILAGTLVQAKLGSISPQRSWDVMALGEGSVSPGNFRPDFDFDDIDCGPKDGDTVYCLRLVGTTRVLADDNGEYLLHLVLSRTNPEDYIAGHIQESEVYQRIGILHDAFGSGKIQLEEGSEARAVQRNVLVKII